MREAESEEILQFVELEIDDVVVAFQEYGVGVMVRAGGVEMDRFGESGAPSLGAVVEVFPRIRESGETPFAVGSVSGLHVDVVSGGSDIGIAAEYGGTVDRQGQARCVERQLDVPKHVRRQHTRREHLGQDGRLVRSIAVFTHQEFDGLDLPELGALVRPAADHDLQRGGILLPGPQADMHVVTGAHPRTPRPRRRIDAARRTVFEVVRGAARMRETCAQPVRLVIVAGQAPDVPFVHELPVQRLPHVARQQLHSIPATAEGDQYHGSAVDDRHTAILSHRPDRHNSNYGGFQCGWARYQGRCGSEPTSAAAVARVVRPVHA
ncbi:hypothetical protein NRB20_60460 [Nocardia sp. RB20]|uniref:Uncharacterized protein n=1 Tax=Nocardia macrotermitis TaxID=2585198 RepID=A0A7K0DC88_9NOCA|nr:hypothetical protein [Nocardia macrotermitis]MQY22922.1 hypothetical protein [Nocardia macrotermitis]